jgi:LmbE family N-acetylglucosaminyl deacetylase
MLELRLPIDEARGPFNVLCLGAHCDDIEIGCGGALLELLRRYRSIHVDWVVFSSTREREKELRRSAGRFLAKAADYRLTVFTFKDGFFPGDFTAIKNAFESLKQLDQPHLIFTHHRADLHQDHRIVAELTWNTFRRHLVLEYEIPKYDGGLTTPTTYVALKRSDVDRKVRILTDCYKTQSMKHWFTDETFRALMRLRGLECGAESGWAEGFHGSKMLLG